MSRVTSVKELVNIQMQINRQAEKDKGKVKVKVHLSTCGLSSGAGKVLEAFEEEIEKRHLKNVALQKASCIGLCGQEPIVSVIDNSGHSIIYHDVTTGLVPRIINEHVINNKPVAEFIIDMKAPRFTIQERRIMRNQDLDPMKIEDYVSRGGYEALAKAVLAMKPEEVLDEIEKSGLRGRGGAGFPTATKWRFVRNSKADCKYIVCNGDEGDPGAYMNRAVLEGNPHSIIEGMAIGAYAIGNVSQGYVYVRAEYPLAIKTLQNAIDQARENGFLGDKIFNTNFKFDLDIFPGAGAFVCGEETALLTSIEGKRGNPRQRPPFPATSGLFDKPTTLNNVETLSNIPLIILNGADWFAQVGNEKAKGTKTLCLVGKLNNTGLVEIPLGTSLGKIIYDLGGGIPSGKQFKAVQIGGPSGGVIPAEHLDTPVDYNSIPALGAIMGSGGVVVMDEDSCMVDVAKFFLDFTKDESCGKCISCREGNAKMYDILTKITEGRATMKDLSVLEELCKIVPSASICGLGQTAPNPVLTTLRYFKDEYEEHIVDKRCRAAVCQSLFSAPCQHTCPVGLDIPGYVSLIDEGKFELAYQLIMQKLPLPFSVGRVCPHPCEKKCRRGQIDEPVAIRHLKRFVADYAFEHGLEYKPDIKSRKSERVAVIGAGPAGLSCAWDLTIEGYPVTIFDSLPVAGGMLATGIPEYRLPKKILNYELENFRKIGIDIQLNSRIDSIDKLLKDGYKAVFVGIGAHKGEKLGIPGDNLSGVLDAVEYLKIINLGNKYNVGNTVVVIGGGNSAIDAARVARREGARQVHIIYRRQQEDMPAEKSEIEAALDEGILLHLMASPAGIIGTKGSVTGIRCIKMEPGDFDKSGRRSPKPVDGSEYIMECDTVIAAIGQRPDSAELGGSYFKTDKGGRILAHKRTLAAVDCGIFAGGDCVTGPSTVIDAVAAGQRAASSMKRFLRGEPLSFTVERNGYKAIPVSTTPSGEEVSNPRQRVKISEIPLKDRSKFEEVVTTYSKGEARAEASRCLRCDLSTGE